MEAHISEYNQLPQLDKLTIDSNKVETILELLEERDALLTKLYECLTKYNEIWAGIKWVIE
jgi:hypothetical protein